MPSDVDDIERIESNAYSGVGVIKVFLHEGADVGKAVSQLAASSTYVMKYMPRNVIPADPALRRDRRPDVLAHCLLIKLTARTEAAGGTRCCWGPPRCPVNRPPAARPRGTS